MININHKDKSGSGGCINGYRENRSRSNSKINGSGKKSSQHFLNSATKDLIDKNDKDIFGVADGCDDELGIVSDRILNFNEDDTKKRFQNNGGFSSTQSTGAWFENLLNMGEASKQNQNSTKNEVDKDKNLNTFTPRRQQTRRNSLKSKQSICDNFSDFLENMYGKGENVIDPYQLKYSIAKNNDMFDNHMQQDAHELMNTF